MKKRNRLGREEGLFTLLHKQEQQHRESGQLTFAHLVLTSAMVQRSWYLLRRPHHMPLPGESQLDLPLLMKILEMYIAICLTPTSTMFLKIYLCER